MVPEIDLSPQSDCRSRGNVFPIQHLGKAGVKFWSYIWEKQSDGMKRLETIAILHIFAPVATTLQ